VVAIRPTGERNVAEKVSGGSEVRSTDVVLVAIDVVAIVVLLNGIARSDEEA
jgi:hypothetical protein